MILGSALPSPWSDWAVVIHDMPDSLEVISPEAHLVTLSPLVTPTVVEAVAHAVAHLELGHHEVEGALTLEMEEWADQLAQLQQDTLVMD